MALTIDRSPDFYSPRIVVSGNTGDLTYTWLVNIVSGGDYPAFREVSNTSELSDTATMPNPDDFYIGEPDGFYDIYVEVADDLDFVSYNFAFPKVPDQPEDFPLFDPDTVNNYDDIYFVLEDEEQTSSGFRTEADTTIARTGTESLGVQFIDQSTAGEPDAIFLLDDGSVVFDAEIEFIL